MSYIGLYGIQAARYYLDIHPEARLRVLESDDVVGGTWSRSMHWSCLLSWSFTGCMRLEVIWRFG